MYSSTHINKEQIAVDNLCNLSLNEGTLQENEQFLSGWTNSYPLKQFSRKTCKLHLPVNSTTNFYQHRYRASRHSQASQL
jgi:hypothetical protein